MKKKECPSCAMEVDAKNKACPICGYEFTGYSSGMKITATLLIILFIALLLLRIF
jgi:RNA polymerase subunit RPABC4/transcription elongation factor Spt4